MTVEDAVYRLGIPGGIKGHEALVIGIKLIMKDTSIRYEAIGRLYPEIARKVNSTPGNVERNIRTAIERCWRKGNRPFLIRIARYELQARPTPVEFMDMVAAYVQWERSRRTTTV